jgi:hypothetical protein
MRLERNPPNRGSWANTQDGVRRGLPPGKFILTSIVTAVIERLADRIHPERAHADALVFFVLGHGLVAIDVTLVPHFSRAIVDYPLPAFFAAHWNDDDGAGVIFGITTLRLDRRFLPLGCQSLA